MSAPEAAKRQGTTLAFAYVTTLFFAWGFATSLIDPLIAAVKRVFDLNNAEAFLTTFAWFIAYGLMSLPAAAVLGRLGYSRSIIGALVVMVAGCLIVPAATAADWYPGVLIALFVIASGVTLLGTVWIGGAGTLVALTGVLPGGRAAVLFLFAVVWTNDVVAFYVGRSFGRRRQSCRQSGTKNLSLYCLWFLCRKILISYLAILAYICYV